MKTKTEVNQEQDLSPEKLKAEIQDLKKQLEDCLNQKPVINGDFISSTELEHMLKMVCAGPFMPRYYTDEKSGSVLRNVYRVWSRLRDSMLCSDSKPFHSHPSFLRALSDLNTVLDKIKLTDVPNQGKEAYDRAAESAGGYCSFSYKEKLEAFICLRDIALHLKEKNKGSLTKEEVDEIIIALTIIIECQKVNMVLDEEEEEELDEEENNGK